MRICVLADFPPLFQMRSATSITVDWTSAPTSNTITEVESKIHKGPTELKNGENYDDSFSRSQWY
jgi:hypothetical protein